MNGTYISLFAGIGGLDLAVESLGFECAGQVEWDDSCTRVLERWWPTVPRWGDVHTFGAAAYAASRSNEEIAKVDGGESPMVGSRSRPSDRNHGGDPAEGIRVLGRGAGVARPDLIIGGFPCQPASTAGRRQGTADDRWLWPEFARVVGELGPRHVLVENVPGLLTVNGGRAFSEVVGDLASLGYDATWASVRAADVGAPHRRERLFLVADTHGEREESGSRRGTPGRDHAGTESAEWDRDRLAGQAEPWKDVAHAENIGHERSWRSRGWGTGPSDGAGFAWGPYAPAIERWERVLMRPAPLPVDDKGRLAPAFVEWMMGFPEGWTSEMKRTQALKALGNAVVPQQAILALSALERMREAA